MKNRSLIAFTLAAAFTFALGGGQNSAAADQSAPSAALTIAVIPKGATHVYWKSVRAGAEAAAAELGDKIYWSAPERESDRERQIQIVEDCITRKVDGVVLAPLDSKALVPSVEKLAALKIPCAIVDSAVDTSQYVSFAATDNYLGGALAARRMGKILDGKGNVIVIKYEVGSASTTDRENGFIDTIQKEFPGIKIIDSTYGQDTMETALEAVEDLLSRDRDVQGMFACNASTCVGAQQALASQNRSEIKLVGFDTEKISLSGVKHGTVDSLVVQNPYKMGYEGVKAVDAALKGRPVTKKIDTGVMLVTRDNLNDPEVQKLVNPPQ